MKPGISPIFVLTSDKLIFTWRRKIRGHKIVSKILGKFLSDPVVKMPGYIERIGFDDNNSFVAVSSGIPEGITAKDKMNFPQVGKVFKGKILVGSFNLGVVTFIEDGSARNMTFRVKKPDGVILLKRSLKPKQVELLKKAYEEYYTGKHIKKRYQKLISKEIKIKARKGGDE